MSDEKIGLEWLGTRVLSLTAEMRDLQRRFTAFETRLSALESRFGGIEARLGVIEERMTPILGLVVRIAEQLDGGAPPVP
jgi:hypothetical protein